MTSLNTPALIQLAAVIRDAGFVVGEAGSTVTRQATPNDALRLVEMADAEGFDVTRRVA